MIQFDDGTTLGPGAFGENVAGTMGSSQLLHRWLGDEWFRQPVELVLLDSQVTDETIVACADGMPDLRLLSISSLNVTDRAMQDISTLAKLETLTLNCPLLTPDGLAKLRPLKSLRKFVSLKVRHNDSIAERLTHSAEELGRRPMSLHIALESIGEAFAGKIQIDPQIARELRPLLMGTEQVSGKALSAAFAEAFRLHDIDYYVKDGICYVKNAPDVAAGRAGFKVVDAMFPNLTDLRMDW